MLANNAPWRTCVGNHHAHAAYVRSVSDYDPAAIGALFAGFAVVKASREFRGRATIKALSDRELCAPLGQGAGHFVRDTSWPICSSRIAHVLKGVREAICRNCSCE